MNFRNSKLLLVFASGFFAGPDLFSQSNQQDYFSIAGFYEIKESGRSVYNFNVGWRFIKAI